MKRLMILPILATAGAAFGQSYNVDLNVTSGSGVGAPAASFGGAAGTSGTWNSITSASAMTAALVDTTGANAGVTFTRSRSTGFSSTNNPATTGDFDKLMDDYQETAVGTAMTYTFNNLPAGNYA